MIQIFSLFVAIAFAGPATLKMYDAKKYVDVGIQTVDEMQFSKECFKGKVPKCDAYTATKRKVTPREPQTEVIGHPAVRYCHDKGGIARILISSDNKQYDYCRFKDGSMIDAWDLYYHDFK